MIQYVVLSINSVMYESVLENLLLSYNYQDNYLFGTDRQIMYLEMHVAMVKKAYP